MTALEELWTRMARMYGHRWTASFGDCDDGTWRAVLRGITPDQVKAGLRACSTREDGWPPSAPEFRMLCQGGRSKAQRAFEARLEDQREHRKALPSPEQLALGTVTGRQWCAFWWLEGIRPRPPSVSEEKLVEMLGNADLDAMRDATRRSRDLGQVSP